MSETTGPESSRSKAGLAEPINNGGLGTLEDGDTGMDGDADGALEVEVEEVAPSPPSGFQAFLQHANLHNLLQVENLSRTTGVFLVTSQGRIGYLHLDNGELIHAECGGIYGEAAAAEILSWDDGEFKSCSRTLSPVVTIQSSLQSLLLRLATAADEAAHERGRPRAAAARPSEDDKPTEPHLPAPQAAVEPQRTSSPPPPRSHRAPPPLPPRIEREGNAVTEVVISASGEIVQGRGSGTEEFSARVAYAARLADLIGRAIRSGTPRALELRGKTTQTSVKWQPDGTLAAAIEVVQPGRR